LTEAARATERNAGDEQEMYAILGEDSEEGNSEDGSEGSSGSEEEGSSSDEA